jgi:hypothetical protein
VFAGAPTSGAVGAERAWPASMEFPAVTATRGVDPASAAATRVFPAGRTGGGAVLSGGVLAVVPPPHRGCLGDPEGAPRKTASEQRVDHAVDADEGEQSPDLAGLGAEPDGDLQSLVAGRDLYRLAHADVRWSKPPSVAAEARSFGSSNASPRGIAAMKSLASAADRARFTSLDPADASIRGARHPRDVGSPPGRADGGGRPGEPSAQDECSDDKRCACPPAPIVFPKSAEVNGR